MSELSSKDVYKFINTFETDTQFLEFARNYLKLKNREMNDISSDYSGNRERKYQAICYWKRKIGRNGTINKLYALKNESDIDNRSEVDQQSRDDLFSASQAAHGSGGVINTRPHEAERGQQGGDNRGNPRQVVGCQQRGIIQANPGQPVVERIIAAEQGPYDGRACNIEDGPIVENFAAMNIVTEAPPQSTGINVEKEKDFCTDVTDFKVVPCTTEETNAIFSLNTMIYPIKNNPKGYVLILGNTPASQKSLGDKDVENMRKLWTEFGCKVIVKVDLPAHEIQEVIGKVVASPRMSAFDFLVVFVMAKSDGNCGDEAFIAADEKPVVLKEILAKFGSKNFEIFAGKPKLFFCQVFASKTEQEIKLPDLDQLLVLSHVPFCTSSRDTTGSWFMNAVSNVFMTSAHNMSVTDMLQRVGSAVESKISSAGTSGPEHSVSFFQTFGNKNLYLLPGYYPKDDLFD